MLATSPLAIIFYVLLAIVLTSAIGRRLVREKRIAEIMRTPPSNIIRTIRLYRTIVLTYKIFIVFNFAFIPFMIYMHFDLEAKKGMPLFITGLLVLMIILAFEDIQYRSSMIARLEAEQKKSQKDNTTHISEEEFEARVRKWRIINIAISLVIIVVIIVAFYLTMGGPWWFYVLIFIIAFSAASLGVWIAYKQDQKGSRT